ncbi:WD40/YVTN/BNR-like repeat-containing protein [Herbaspirillum chlorophenolicum]|uniref:WD40/YVTN/BNR-like repeat-containing protein n=1 Tax=Herbaspirillum chlorophenolicum TaxID=211589 RepID=A0ABW8EY48_9BURK
MRNTSASANTSTTVEQHVATTTSAPLSYKRWQYFSDLTIGTANFFLVKYFPVDQLYIATTSSTPLKTSHLAKARGWFDNSYIPSTNPKYIKDVAFDETTGTYLAVGSAGLFISTDQGKRWTQKTAPVSTNYNATCVAHGNGKWVVGWSNGSITTSPTAENGSWTTLPATTFAWSSNYVDSVFWTGTRFVAGSQNKISSSADTVTWTNVSTTIYGTRVFSKNSAGRLLAGLNPNGTLYSDDNGLTWNVSTSVFTNSGSIAIAYSPSLDAFVAADAGGRMGYSTTAGMSWTAVTSSFGGSAINSLTWSDDDQQFVAAGASGKMAYSSDGITWTQRTNPTPIFSAVGFASGSFYGGISGNNGKLYKSPDGAVWAETGASFGAAADKVNRIREVNGKVIVGASRGQVSVSDDGGASFNVYDTGITADVYDVAYGNGYIAVGSDANGSYFSTSPDAHTWTYQGTFAVGGASGSTRITFGNGVFVRNTDSSMAYSADGINWSVATGGPLPASDLIFDNGLFIAAKEILWKSVDGITWTQAGTVTTNNAAQPFRNITRTSDKYLLGAYGAANASLAVIDLNFITDTTAYNTMSISGTTNLIAYGNDRVLVANRALCTD